MMKKILGLLFLAFFPIAMMAYDCEVNGIFYNLNNNTKTAEVTYESSTSYPYSGEVVIPSSILYNGITYSVTRIGSNAFEDCTGLTAITIPESVTRIGYGAFSGCNGLPVIDHIRYADTYLVEAVDKNQSSYTIQPGTRFIGTFAFLNCSNMTSITIPESVTSIGNEAFSFCENLPVIDNLRYAGTIVVEAVDKTQSSYTIQPGTRVIGYEAFKDCSNLTTITIPSGVKTIGYEAFINCSNLGTLSIPSTVTSIEDFAFNGNNKLTSINIPSGITSIGDNAFYGSGLTSIDIPSQVTSIGDNAFEFCSSLTTISIPNSVTSIGTTAFLGCSNLTSIHIPESVTSIGAGAFLYCSGLTSITVDDGNPVYDSRNNCNALIETSSNRLLVGCKNTTNFQGVVTIESGAFQKCTGLTAITIPSSVTSIASDAFSGCTGLTTLDIPSSVTSIGGGAFSGCQSLTSVTVNWLEPLAISYGMWDDAIFYNVPLENATLYVPSGTKEAYEVADDWKDFGRILSVVNVVENGNLEGEPSNGWSSFWVNEWRTMDKQFLGPANIVADPTNANNHCIKVVVRSEAEAREAGNMIDDGNGNYAPYESVFFVQSKQEFESGKVLRLTMRVKADKEAVIQTQAHRAPDEYNHWNLFGNIHVTDTWQTVEKEVVLTPEMAQMGYAQGMRTVAFLLATVPEGNVFYFDDIKLDYESMTQKGDLNNDGDVDIYDVTALIDIILEGDTTPPYKMTQYDHLAADFNNDYSIDIYDVTLLIDFILNKE